MNSTNIFTAFLLILFFAACNSPEKERAKSSVVSHTFKSTDGTILKVDFNNTEQTAVIKWKDKTIELKSNHPASGFWYKSDEYELRGKGEEIKLSKNGNVVFQSNTSQ